jgi:4-amino-4-deoxy-L-arabinose transferase-like glycosyltransferase
LEERGKLALLAAVAGALLLLFLRLGSYPLLDPDEARFARTSVEMMRSGDYVVPTFEGEPRLVKPPLLNWVQSSMFQLAGPSEMLARLPAAGSTLISLLLVAWIGWRRFGVEGSAWAAIVFLTFPLVVLIARIGTLDALLSVHVLAIIALDLVQHDHTELDRSAVIGGLLGLAFLVKGPVGVLLPLVMILAGRTATGRDVMPSLKTFAVTVSTWCAVVLPWGLVFIRRIGGAGVVQLIRSETVDRAVTGSAHVEPWWYYLGVCAVAFLPWAGPLLLGIGRGMARWHDEESPTGPYAAAAFTAGLVFFSLSKGKLPNYILPLAPLAALVVTFELGQELVNPTRRRAGSSMVAITLVALAIGLGVASAMSLENDARGAASTGAAAFGIASLVALWGTLKSAPRMVYGAAAVGTFTFLLAVVNGAPPVLATTRSSAPLVAAVPALRSMRPLVLVDTNLPSLTYYADRVPEKVTGRDLGERLDRGDSPLVVLDDVDRDRLLPAVRSRLKELAHSGTVRVFEPVDASLTPAGSPW